MSLPVLTGAGLVTVSGHAIDRYIERVKPAYTPGHAHWELARLLPQAQAFPRMPVWAEHPEVDNAERYETDCFLVLCDSLLFPVFGGVVLTTLVRGQIGPLSRAARSRSRRARHGVSRAIKLSQRSGVRRRQDKAKKHRNDWRRDVAA